MKVIASGFVVVDIIAADLPRLPKPGDLVFAPKGIEIWIGGHAANLSVDLIQLGLKEVGVILTIGKDIFGNFIENFLRSHKVICFLNKVEEKSGKTLVIVVSGKDRSFISDVGANLYHDFNYVYEVLKKEEPKVFYLACGILGDFDKKIDKIFEFCKERGIITVLDVLKPFGKNWDFIHPALKFTDILHSNPIELYGITGSQDLKRGLLWLKERGVKLPIVSNGSKGLLAIYKDRLIKQPAFKVKVIDPTGAGDALCAGVIFKLLEKDLENLDLEEVCDSLLFGQACGAACVEAIGTTAGVTKDRVNEILMKQGPKVKSRTIIENLKSFI